MKTTKRALLSSVLSLFLCFVMLMGTTFAWFTDSVTSANNVIQTGTLDVTFEWVDGSEDPTTTTAWTDASTGAIFDYANWEPGYAAARHLKVSNVGTLALNYQMRIVANGVVSKLADAIDVYYIAEDAAAERTDIANATYLGTLTEVLGTAKNLSNTINGSLKVDDPADIHTIILKMNELAGNEYQGMDLGCTFSVELIATQKTAESDSFGTDYDANVPDPSIPAALVRPLGDLTINYTTDFPNNNAPLGPTMDLDAAFQFEPTETLDAANVSEYRHWHADYVVTADRDVPMDSVTLAGYYAAFCDDWNGRNWVALMDDSDSVLAAGEEVRLVQAMGSGNISVSYKDLCQYGNDNIGFLCGLAARDAAAVAGTTVTVELRIYEVTSPWYEGTNSNVETGKYITIGEFKYTFEYTAEALASQIADGGEIVLTNDVEMDANTAVTVAAGKNVVLDLNGHKITSTANKTGNQELFLVKGNMTVKNGSIELTAENNQGWGAMATIFDVTAGGSLTMEGVEATVSGTDMNFIVHLNNWGSATLYVDNCDFNATYVAVRAFNSGYDMNTVTIKNTDVTGGARLFWVHNYTAEGQSDATLTLDIYGNNNTCEHDVPVRFGFSNSVFFDLNGNPIV